MRKCNWLLSGSVCTHLRLCYYCRYRSRNLNSNKNTSWCSVLLALFKCMSCFLYTESCIKLESYSSYVRTYLIQMGVHITVYTVNFGELRAGGKGKQHKVGQLNQKKKRLVDCVLKKPQCSNGLCSTGVPCRGFINQSSHSVWQPASAWHEHGGRLGRGFCNHSTIHTGPFSISVFMPSMDSVYHLTYNINILV